MKLDDLIAHLQAHKRWMVEWGFPDQNPEVQVWDNKGTADLPVVLCTLTVPPKGNKVIHLHT